MRFSEFSFRGLRHGAARLMLAAGVDDAVIARVMGHANTRILKRYQDVVPAVVKDAAQKMGALLGRGL